MDFLSSIYCIFAGPFITRAALVTFSNAVVTRIPFEPYTPDQWGDQIAILRNDQSLCCRCCTPLAEAFQRAAKIFSNAPDVAYVPIRTILVITDGEPYQNTAGNGFLFPTVSYANYMLNKVPDQAAWARNQNPSIPARLMLLGIPNKDGVPPLIDYFVGTPDPARTGGPSFPANRQCFARGIRNSCGLMNAPPFPLVSQPVSDNTFSLLLSDSTIQSEVVNVASKLCGVVTNSPASVLPTTSPTKAPVTGVPTGSPTKAPSTIAPSGLPTVFPTPSPV